MFIVETKNKITSSVFVIAGLILIIAGIFAFAGRSAPKPPGITVSVLFLGNSLTSVNDLPKTISNLAQSLGDTVEYDAYDPGGYTLKQDSQDQTALDKIKSRPWDYVVLQEQSEMPALQDSRVSNEVIPYALQLDSLIHPQRSVAKTVFFETWGYKDGDAQYCASTPTLCNYTVMQNQLTKSYHLMAQKTGALLAPVGEAWQTVRQTHPEIPLYGDDRHPSPEGTYLAACVFYETLFKKDVAGASSLTLDKFRAKILQQVASQTVLGK